MLLLQLLIWGLLLAQTGRDQAAARQAVLAVASDVAIGSSFELAKARCDEAAREAAIRCKEESAGQLAVVTPSELGAKNWRLLIRAREGIVTSVRVVTDDGWKTPVGAPPPRGDDGP